MFGSSGPLTENLSMQEESSSPKYEVRMVNYLSEFTGLFCYRYYALGNDTFRTKKLLTNQPIHVFWDKDKLEGVIMYLLSFASVSSMSLSSLRSTSAA
jgi:hypothetical protein